MQSFTHIEETRTLQESRGLILNNFYSVMSDFAGTAFPTANLEVGMICYRADLKRAYRLLDAAAPVWEPLPEHVTVETVNSALTLTREHHARFLDVTAAVTITLPDAGVEAGMFVLVKNASGGDVTLARTGTDTVDGSTSVTLAAGEQAQVYRAANDWKLFGRTKRVATESEVINGSDAEHAVTPSAASAAGMIPRMPTVPRTSGMTIYKSHRGRLFECSGTFTLSLDAAGTLGDGFMFAVRNDGSGLVTIDPYSSQTIDGATALTLYPGQSCLVCGDGSDFSTVGLSRRLIDQTYRTYSVTLSETDLGQLQRCSGTFTLYLPNASGVGDGWWTRVLNVGTGTVTIDPYSSQTIAGEATKALKQNEGVTVRSNGSNWEIVEITAAVLPSANSGEETYFGETFVTFM